MNETRQKWVVCPKCGSQDAWARVEAVEDSIYSNVIMQCPDCEHTDGDNNV